MLVIIKQILRSFLNMIANELGVIVLWSLQGFPHSKTEFPHVKVSVSLVRTNCPEDSRLGYVRRLCWYVALKLTDWIEDEHQSVTISHLLRTYANFFSVVSAMVVSILLSLIFESGKLKVDVEELALIVFNVELQTKRDITAEFETRKTNI